MKKIDIFLAFLTGEITALYITNLLGLSSFFAWLLAIIFPLLTVFCLWLAYLIGQKYLFIVQFAKFALVGVMATIFDLGTLSIFISATGINSGLHYDIYKAISFIISTTVKYVPDKFWAFKKTETSGAGKEFSKFFIVTLISFIINVSIAHFIVNIIGPQFGISPKLWANLGAIGAVFITFAWNFIGYKFIVFKK